MLQLVPFHRQDKLSCENLVQGPITSSEPENQPVFMHSILHHATNAGDIEVLLHMAS